MLVIVVNNAMGPISTINWVVQLSVNATWWNCVLSWLISYKRVTYNHETEQNLFSCALGNFICVGIGITSIICKLDSCLIFPLFICISHIKTSFWGYYINRICVASFMEKHFKSEVRGLFGFFSQLILSSFRNWL